MAYPDEYGAKGTVNQPAPGEWIVVNGREGQVVRHIHFNVYVVWFRGNCESEVIQL